MKNVNTATNNSWHYIKVFCAFFSLIATFAAALIFTEVRTRYEGYILLLWALGVICAILVAPGKFFKFGGTIMAGCATFGWFLLPFPFDLATVAASLVVGLAAILIALFCVPVIFTVYTYVTDICFDCVDWKKDMTAAAAGLAAVLITAGLFVAMQGITKAVEAPIMRNRFDPAGTGMAEAAGASAASAGGTAATGAASVGLGAKFAAMPIVTKIIAGIAAVAVAVGGGAALIDGMRHDCEDLNRDCVCDTCGNTVHHGDPNLDHDAFCVVCGASIGIHDNNEDYICDICGEYPCGAIHQEAHFHVDGSCELCGAAENPHTDGEEDGFCDHCGDAMCRLELAEHRIPEGSCLCEFCGEGSHTEGDAHPFCGTCRTRLPLDDRDGDGSCDVCGEYSCGGSYHGNQSHADEDGDERCDICKKYMCGLVWGLEHTINYDDGIYDGKCDKCGGTPYAMGWAEDENEAHADGNNDGRCDQCGRNMCKIYSMLNFGGVDADGDEKCDICKLFLCDGHDGFSYHYDFDGDGKCDRCDHYICAHGYLPHTDGNLDGICDLCYSRF